MTINELFTDLAVGYQEHKEEYRAAGRRPLTLEEYLKSRDVVGKLRKVLNLP